MNEEQQLPSLPPGYVLEQVLATGGRAGVAVVRAHRGADSVVLRLDPSRVAEEARAELAVLAAVDHPRIAGLLDHGPLPGGGVFSARRWVAGEDLASWSRAHTPEEIGRVVVGLGPALDHLHGLGFVHGDLKAENVIVDEAGAPLLVDFGFAATSGAAQEGVRGSLLGLAPELLAGLPPTPATDRFALGALLFGLLAEARTEAREFYAHFPTRSFLDAAGTDPEELPVWSRDLIVSLTARDAARRPLSATDVARSLAERLGEPLASPGGAARLRFPVASGREATLDPWSAASASEHPLWMRVPASEDPRAFWEELRLAAARSGHSAVGLDLGLELRALRNGLALDRWARAVARRTSDPLAVLLPAGDTWARHAATVLVRALAQRETPSATVIVATTEVQPEADEASEVHDVPPIADAALVAFLRRALPSEEPARVADFGARLAAAARGSATAIDAGLCQATEAGWILDGGSGLHLRPGPLDAFAPQALATEDTEQRDLSLAARRLLAALRMAGPGAAPERIAAALEVDARELAPMLSTLAARALVRVERTGGRMTWTAAGGADRIPLDSGAARALHGKLAATSAGEVQRALHAFCADPAAGVAELTAAIESLREQGSAELALDALERVSSAARGVGIDLLRAGRLLEVERADTWCDLGNPAQALAALEPLEAGATASESARVALVRARVAALRHRTEDALQELERAESLAAEVGPLARAGRIKLLHAIGRDRDVRTAWEALSRDTLAALSPRRHAELWSFAAMSSFRLGDTEAARETLTRLVASAATRNDAALEAALRLNLATIERRAGTLDAAREHLDRSLAQYERAGHAAGLALAQSTLGGILRERGELLRADELLREAQATRERLGDMQGAVLVRGLLGLLLFERGHVRPAIETLVGSAGALEGGARRRSAPLLLAKAEELRARIGEASGELPAEDADPRVLLALSRARWLRDEEDAAREFADRAAQLARELGFEPVALEAERMRALLGGEAPPPEASPTPLDRLAAVGDAFDADATEQDAADLERAGVDDRAARLWQALAARLSDPERASLAQRRADACFERCSRGLSAAEQESLHRHLLGIPDPWSGDLAPRRDRGPSDEVDEMDVVSILDLNRRLARQENLDTLLPTIVSSALEVTGAERGFLVLEQDGELAFDTARDSLHGNIPAPELEVSRSVVEEALERDKALRISNAVDDPTLGHAASVVSLELRSILCVPFRIDSSTRGAMYLDHRLRTGAFDERAERLAGLLADQAALAIQKVRRLEEIRVLNRRLEQRVEAQAADLVNARRELDRSREKRDEELLIGGSEAIGKVRAMLDRFAASDLPVLIQGDSGTGKELAAQTLHRRSSRRDGPFVAESCAALPATLIESELFGYRRGAFTGADQDRAGLFERATGGTFLLDEIGEMPLELQAKLLRVLETGEIRRLGDTDARAVDFRLVTATNRDLEVEVREGRFRQDLYYRIEGLRVSMPALTERPEDIATLARHFLDLEATGGAPRRITNAVIAALAQRAWPGNVRELRNEIARLCVLCEGDLDDPSVVRSPARVAEAPSALGEVLPLAELERRAILAAIEQAGGDKRKAAELLGISRAKIYQRLKEWSTDSPGAA